MNYKSINFENKLNKFKEQWKPKVIAKMNDYQFKFKKKDDKRRFIKTAIGFISFCIAGLGIFYMVLMLHFSRWEDTEKIKAMDRPATNTLIEKEFNSYGGADYFETFQIELPQTDTGSLTKHLNDIVETKRPIWFSALYRVRDVIVGPLGLKTSKKHFTINKKPNEFEVGERFRTFKITALSENEIVFGDDDKHLVFSCSISKSVQNGQNYLYFTTLVRFKNIWGPIYFFAVKPVHRLMIKTKLKNYIQKIYN